MSDSSSKPPRKKPRAPAVPQFTAFTLKADAPVRRIQFDVGITPAVPGEAGVPRAQLKQYKALLDTVAERTRVSRKVIESVGLESSGSNGASAQYHADVYLPNMIRFTKVPVTRMPVELEAQADWPDRHGYSFLRRLLPVEPGPQDDVFVSSAAARRDRFCRGASAAA